VPTGAIREMPPEARDHEPLVTLDGGADGLEVHRRIATSAPDWLAPGGSLLVEVHEDQAPVLAAIFETVGFTATIETSADDATVVRGRALAAAAE
jgi:release factor glutamine methyltransferase